MIINFKFAYKKIVILNSNKRNYSDLGECTLSFEIKKYICALTKSLGCLSGITDLVKIFIYFLKS